MIALLAVLLGLATLLVLILPYRDRRSTHQAPSIEDPVEEDLEEERDALLEAVRELEARDDLQEEHRSRLRDRYEAKAARALKRLDEHRLASTQAGERVPRRRRAPAGLLMTLVLIVPSLFLIGEYVLPRMSGGTVTTFQSDSIALGRRLRTLQRDVARDPSKDAMMELADIYWQQGIMDPAMAPTAAAQATMQADSADARLRAAELYQRVEGEFPPLPALGHQRLGLIAVNDSGDLVAGVDRFEKARELEPQNLDTLYTLGELHYAQGDMSAATEAWEAFLVAPGGGVESAAVSPRLEAARMLAPLVEQVEANRTSDTLLALADAYWELGDRNSAAGLYAEGLTEFDAEIPRAVRRLGIALFTSGRTEEAVLVLERARAAEPDDLETLMFLGNAYFTLREDERAIELWQRYISVAGGPELAGRVPQLIEQAQARLEGRPLAEPAAGTPPTTSERPPTGVTGVELFQANCATCHGPGGAGGVGPRLAGNARFSSPELVSKVVQDGRGVMPGFRSLLSESELETLVDHVVLLSER